MEAFSFVIVENISEATHLCWRSFYPHVYPMTISSIRIYGVLIRSAKVMGTHYYHQPGFDYMACLCNYMNMHTTKCLTYFLADISTFSMAITVMCVPSLAVCLNVHTPWHDLGLWFVILPWTSTKRDRSCPVRPPITVLNVTICRCPVTDPVMTCATERMNMPL